MAEEKKRVFTWEEKKLALRRQLSPYARAIAILTILEMLLALANGIVPYITGKFIDSLVAPHMTVVPMFGRVPLWEALIGAWLILQVFSNGISFIADRRTRLMTTEMEAGFQAKAYTHLLTLPLNFFKTTRVGEINENLSRASWMLGSFTNTMVSIVPQFLTILVGVGISFLILPQLAFVLLAGIALYLLVLVFIIPRTSKYQSEAFEIWNRTSGDAADAYANFQTVKQAGAEPIEMERIRRGFYEEATPIWYRLEQFWSNLNFAQRAIVLVTQTAIFLLSVYYISHGVITVGDLIAFNAYAGMIIGPFVQLGTSWQTIQNSLVALARSERVFGAASELYDPPQAIRLSELRGDVSFRNVHFAYGDDQRAVLNGVSFEARAGEVVALVGQTGVGKSTTAELVSGYYFPRAGEVLVDGHDIRTLNLRDLRRHIAVVPQEVVLFNASIADNIRYGRPEATLDDVKAACAKADAATFIEQFPNGYDQQVGERGVKLSVGQKQRVAIARAILRDPKILILDEPTSALDPQTERFITTSLEELMRGRTTFVIAHRLSTVRKADKIIVLKAGKVAEMGTHEELMRIPDGEYRRLYELHIGLHE